MKHILLFSFFFFPSFLKANPNDSTIIRGIYDKVLTEGACYENLRVLCKTVGHRISGSPAAEKAVVWGKKVMDTYSLDKVWLQEVMVPKWVRGTKEKASANVGKGKPQPLDITALGGSIGTNGIMKGELVEVNHFDDLKKIGKSGLEGKIVLFNRPFDPKFIHTFHAYGGCVNQRVHGAAEASGYGVKAVLIRSMTHSKDNHPHTGGMIYVDSLKKIPAAAISTENADYLSAELKKGNKISITLELNCELQADVKSHNVIGEITGSVYPDKIITVGGHLDSWDIGEGAHDDGAGCVQSMEVLHLLRLCGIKPKHTIRAVLFMNEENGLRGGKKYADEAIEKKEKHIAAIESDRGGFAPRGFTIEGNKDPLWNWFSSLGKMLAAYDLHYFEAGGSGADIGPLKKKFPDIVLFGFIPDSQRYFDYHHAETDVFEAVNKRELELGAAAMTTLIYLIDNQLK